MSSFLHRLWRTSILSNNLPRMAYPPPRKACLGSTKTFKQDTTPLRILLQMGFPKHRALKALAATGNRSVQLASDWLLTHVNDASLDADEPREYILYASPTGPLLTQLFEFWDQSKTSCGWNGAHNFPPHITLVSFFKAPDETSLQLAKALKHVVEMVGDPPTAPLKLEPYVSHNFMGLFVSEQHADYLKKIAVQYVKHVSSASPSLQLVLNNLHRLNSINPPTGSYDFVFKLDTHICRRLYILICGSIRGYPRAFKYTGNLLPLVCNAPRETHSMLDIFGVKHEELLEAVNLEAHVKSLHITLAYHFEDGVFDKLKTLVSELRLSPRSCPGWELRLYSRDARTHSHHVHKVVQSYTPKAKDELELVLGDYVYVEQKELEATADGWVHGISWLTGVSGYLPVVYTRRTAESDAWTLHRAVSLGNSSDCKSESDSNTETDMASYSHEDAHGLGHEKSEESYKEWEKYWNDTMLHKHRGYFDSAHETSAGWKPPTSSTNGDTDSKASSNCSPITNGSECGRPPRPSPRPRPRRWYFALRHGERVDLTYGHWTPFCFDANGVYARKDLNLPLTLPERRGGADAHARDSPLTRVGRLQARLVGEGLRLAGVRLRHVYASAALRCVETAHELLQGLQGDPSVKVRVEPGLFEYKVWHAAKGVGPFMSARELHAAGYHVDLSYKPLVDLDTTNSNETLEEFYKRNEKVMHSVIKDTESEGGNIMFVGHAATLDLMVAAVNRLNPDRKEKPYQISKNLLRVPYCALAAMRDYPWQVVCPPCPPSINSSSGRFDWKILLEDEAKCEV